MISIIIPVFNVEAYICQCLESITRQTFKDIEVILVDDCSSDRSIETAQAFIDGYSGPIEFIIIRHDYNRGQSAARNTGLAIARGEYISFIDSDDYVAPETYETMLRYFADSSPDVGVVMCGLISDTDGILADFYKTEVPFKIMPEDFIDYMMIVKAPVCAGAKLMRSYIFDNVKYREGYKNEDTLFAFDLRHDVLSRNIVCLVVPEQFYYYRQHSGSTIHNPFFYLDSLANLEEIMEALKTERYSLYLNQQLKYLDIAVRAALEAKSSDSAIHSQYQSLCRKLRTMPDSLAKEHFSKERYMRFLLLKYVPAFYETVCRCCNIFS